MMIKPTDFTVFFWVGQRTLSYFKTARACGLSKVPPTDEVGLMLSWNDVEMSDSDPTDNWYKIG